MKKRIIKIGHVVEYPLLAAYISYCSGELVWPDGRKYVGQFQEGQQEGSVFEVYSVKTLSFITYIMPTCFQLLQRVRHVLISKCYIY